MKKLICALTALLMLLSVTACTAERAPETTPATTEPIEQTEPNTEPTAPVVTDPIILDDPMIAVSLPALTRTETAEDGTVIFNCTYQEPAMTMTAQAPAEYMLLDLRNRIDAHLSTADSLLSDAKAVYAPNSNWIPYSCQIVYSPMRIDRAVLSLYGSIVTYSGGSHPDRACVAANYDLLSADTLTLGSILTHEDVREDLCQLIIAHLDEIADEKYLRDGYAEDVRSRFLSDVSFDEDWYFSENGLCFFFAPYEIAPYSSGVIVSEIPYSELVGILMDDFFPAEQQPLSGALEVTEFSPDDATSYQQISELILDDEGDMYLIHATASVQNIRVKIAATQTVESYTAYAAQYLNPGDAIMIQASADDLSGITIEYYSEDTIKTVTLE